MKNQELKVKVINMALNVAFDETINPHGQYFGVESEDGLNVMQETAFNPSTIEALYKKDMTIVTDWSDECDAKFMNEMEEAGIECDHAFNLLDRVHEYYLDQSLQLV
jgi:hypothetical protein